MFTVRCTDSDGLFTFSSEGLGFSIIIINEIFYLSEWVYCNHQLQFKVCTALKNTIFTHISKAETSLGH